MSIAFLNKEMRITNQELKTAYQIVTADFLTKVKQAKDGQGIRLSEWGTFVKSKQKIKAWDKKTYSYWRISFRASTNLKKALDD